MIGRITTGELDQSEESLQQDKLVNSIAKLSDQYGQLQELVNELEAKKASLQPIQPMVDEINAKQAEIARLEATIERYKETISQMGEQATAVEAKKVEHEKYIFSNKQLETQASELNKKIFDLNAEIQKIEGDLISTQKNAETQKEKIASEIAQHNKNKFSAQLEVESVKNEIYQLKQVQQGSENDISTLRNTIKQLSGELSSIQSIHQNWMKKIKELENDHSLKSDNFTAFFDQKEKEIATKLKKLQEIEGAISLKETYISDRS